MTYEGIIDVLIECELTDFQVTQTMKLCSLMNVDNMIYFDKLGISGISVKRLRSLLVKCQIIAKAYVYKNSKFKLYYFNPFLATKNRIVDGELYEAFINMEVRPPTWLTKRKDEFIII